MYASAGHEAEQYLQPVDDCLAPERIHGLLGHGGADTPLRILRKPTGSRFGTEGERAGPRARPRPKRGGRGATTPRRGPPETPGDAPPSPNGSAITPLSKRAPLPANWTRGLTRVVSTFVGETD
jgi:hypothetical protein